MCVRVSFTKSIYGFAAVEKVFILKAQTQREIYVLWLQFKCLAVGYTLVVKLHKHIEYDRNWKNKTNIQCYSCVYGRKVGVLFGRKIEQALNSTP